MGASPTVTRRHRSQLRPVKTNIASSPISKRRSPRVVSPALNSVGHPSPSIVAARSFYLEHEVATGPQTSPLQWSRSPFEVHEFPRRHSVMAGTGDLAVRFATFTFASPTLQTVSEAIKTEESRDLHMTSAEVKQNDFAKMRAIAARRSATASAAGTNVPFRYIHDRLRNWGNVYLGNTATADVFVNAVGLRRPSMAPSNEENTEAHTTPPNLVTIRARVLPKAKERKPFIIQRQFDIDDLRSSIPTIQSTTPEGPVSRLRRSNRNRRASAQQLGNNGQRKDGDYNNQGGMPSLGEGAIPLHVEYALHYLPVLGALLLSGHVRKGDSVDLPMPHPEAWPDVVSYIYTSRPDLTVAMKENILFFAGNCSG